jgi:putative transposase
VRTGSPGHLRTFNYLGLYPYFLTFCTHKRRRLLTTSEQVALVRTQIERGAAEHEFAVIAYCFMPDHLHLLVEARAEGSDCHRFITRAKQYSGFHFGQTFGQRLWQRYGFERTLRDDESTLTVARYVVENPVRAGLVRQVADYPFVGSNVYRLEDILEAIQIERMPPHSRGKP